MWRAASLPQPHSSKHSGAPGGTLPRVEEKWVIWSLGKTLNSAPNGYFLQFKIFNRKLKPTKAIIIIIIIILWLCWVFVSVQGLSLVAASGGRSSSRCAGLSLSRPLLLRSTRSRRAGSAIVAHGPSRSVACGIFPDHGSNPCPLHWQADSQPLRHQGSPRLLFLIAEKC